MANVFSNYEDYEKEHLQDSDLYSLEKEVEALEREEAIDPSGIVQTICKIYRKIRPLLDALLKLPFIPEKIKRVIRTFMKILDLLCGISDTN